MTFIWFMVSLNCSSWCADDSASSLMSVSFISFSCSCCCNSNTDSSWLTGRRTNLQHSFITAWRTSEGATYSLETSLVSRTWEASECRYKFISADLMLTYFNSPVFISTDLSKCMNVHYECILTMMMTIKYKCNWLSHKQNTKLFWFCNKKIIWW